MAIIAQSARYGSGLFGLSEYGQINLSVALTGISASGSVNTVSENISEKLNSVSVTGSVGTLKATVHLALLALQLPAL